MILVTSAYAPDSGIFSYYRYAPIVLYNIRYTTVAQWIAAELCRNFGAEQALETVMSNATRYTLAAITDTIPGYDPEYWQAICRDIAMVGTRAKYTQHASLQSALVATGTEPVVYACVDLLWGTGLMEFDSRIQNPQEWPGLHLFGSVLQQIRMELTANG